MNARVIVHMTMAPEDKVLVSKFVSRELDVAPADSAI